MTTACSNIQILDSSVLVLNRLYQAIHITTVKKAFKLFYLNYVKAVEEDYSTYSFEEWRDISQEMILSREEYIQTVSCRLKIPRVILLVGFDSLPRYDVKFTRKNIYLRDNYQCQYCGGPFPSNELNLDHVIPVSRGGKSTWQNTVCSCIDCNTRKGNRLLSEKGMTLVKKPRKPNWYPLVKVADRQNIPSQWKNFLDIAYWNTELHP